MDEASFAALSHAQSRAVHTVAAADLRAHPTPLTLPIYTSSTYRLASADHGARLCADDQSGPESAFLYARWSNPTCRAVAKHIAALEGGYDAHMTSSGIAAVSTVLLTFLRAGDHCVMSHSVYGGTHDLALELLPRYGIEVTWVSEPTVAQYRAALRPHTRLLYAESPSNPSLRCVDFAALAALAQAHGIVCAVDSTFASPALQQPLTLGFDLVLHSCTKYIGGHSDLLAGVIVARTAALWTRIDHDLRLLGAVLSPHDAFLVERGLKTLPLRMAAHCENALAIARFLEAHPKVASVLYPGLESHVDHAIAKAQMRGGFGGVIAFEVKGGVAAGQRLIECVKLITLAVSLGGVESLITHAASTTHLHVPREQRLASGITDGLIRLSVGIEGAADLIADLAQALDSVDV